MPPPSNLPYASQGQLWSFDSDPASAFTSPFQDIFFSSLDNFDVGLDFANSDAFLGTEYYPNPNGIDPNSRRTSNWNIGTTYNDDERHKILIDHFVQSANPISVILPTHTEWSSACRSLLAMANESAFLRCAICALSALHLYVAKTEDSFDEAFRNYKLSSKDVNAVLDHPNVEDRQLKQALSLCFY